MWRNSDEWVGLNKLPGLAGIGIIILGLMLGYKKAQANPNYDNETIWWVFVDTALIPVALGVLILVAWSIALKLANKDN
jgi:hypothetical protein